jgi:hypothetical protein
MNDDRDLLETLRRELDIQPSVGFEAGVCEQVRLAPVGATDDWRPRLLIMVAVTAATVAMMLAVKAHRLQSPSESHVTMVDSVVQSHVSDGADVLREVPRSAVPPQAIEAKSRTPARRAAVDLEPNALDAVQVVVAPDQAAGVARLLELVRARRLVVPKTPGGFDPETGAILPPAAIEVAPVVISTLVESDRQHNGEMNQ